MRRLGIGLGSVSTAMLAQIRIEEMANQVEVKTVRVNEVVDKPSGLRRQRQYVEGFGNQAPIRVREGKRLTKAQKKANKKERTAYLVGMKEVSDAIVS